jgi:hypothetical protein
VPQHEGPFLLGNKLHPKAAARASSADGGYPAARWCETDRTIPNWPLLKADTQSKPAKYRYELCAANDVEACVYLAGHCSEKQEYAGCVWAVLHTPNMPFHEVHT